MEKYKLSSGEIAKLCNIHKKTLFYYDQIGLLKPATVEDNGYRYYTSDQVDVLSRIKALQSVGFSLTEIKQQLTVEDVSIGIATLHQQKQKIERKAIELLQVHDALAHKLTELQHYEQVGTYRIFVKEFREEWLQVDELPPAKGSMTNYLLDGYHFGVILTNTDHSKQHIKITKYQQVTQLEVANGKREKGNYAGVYFTSDENNIISNAWSALAMIKSHGYSVSDQAYIKDIASDFVNFQEGRTPFQLTMKIKDD